MKYPYLNEIPTTKQTVDVFRGYNHNLRIGSGEFYDMENMTSDFYPVLSPRGARGVYEESEFSLDNIIGKSKLCYSDGQSIMVGGKAVGADPTTELPSYAEYSTFVSMGAYLIAFSHLPENPGRPLNFWTYVNTEDINESGRFGNFGYSGNIRYTLCEANGAPLEPVIAIKSSTPPEREDEVGGLISRLCLETGYVYVLCEHTPENETTQRKVYRYNRVVYTGNSAGVYLTYEEIQPYVMIQAGKINRRRRAGESIKVLQLTDGGCLFLNALKTENTENTEDTAQIVTIGGVGEITAFNSGFITVPGVIVPEEDDFYNGSTDGGASDLSYEQKFKPKFKYNQIDYEVPGATISFEAFVDIPYMDYVCERGNRLWGCRYGKNSDGDFVNEIYVSARGDFEQWYRFEGDASDSYHLTVGSDGPFTGCAAFGDCTVFFKENCIHKVYGMYPEQFYSVDVEAVGVERGSHRSIVSMDGVLYYKSPHGVCAYDGSLPIEISEPLGNVSYSDAVACGFDGKYYISMKDASDKWHLFVYDIRRQMWHREDDTRMVSADVFEGNMYYSDGNTIRTVRSDGTEPIKWRCETGVIGDENPERKYMSKINVKMSLDIGSVVRFYARYDSLSEPEHICTLEGDSLQTFTIPIRLRRCDHMSLIIEGEGEAKIYSITKVLEKGSDVI